MSGGQIHADAKESNPAKRFASLSKMAGVEEKRARLEYSRGVLAFLRQAPPYAVIEMPVGGGLSVGLAFCAPPLDEKGHSFRSAPR